MLLDMDNSAAEPQAHRLGSAEWPTTPMVWTADGRRLFLLVNRTGGDDDILLRDLETNSEEVFIATPENDIPLCLSRDGSELLFWQGSQLMAVAVAGGVPRHFVDCDDLVARSIILVVGGVRQGIENVCHLPFGVVNISPGFGAGIYPGQHVAH